MHINPAFIAPPLHALVQLWCRTLRYAETNRISMEQYTQAGKPVVICLWHDEIFPLFRLKRDLRMVAMVSASRDGELLARVLRLVDVESVRGSSSRGGLRALLQAEKRMREGLSACLTVDGPRGPRHEAKKGAIFLACKAGVPLVPIRIFMDKKWRFNSWDRFQLPKPWSHVRMVCADAYRPTCDCHDVEGIERETRLLTERLEGVRDPGRTPAPAAQDGRP